MWRVEGGGGGWRGWVGVNGGDGRRNRGGFRVPCIILTGGRLRALAG